MPYAVIAHYRCAERDADTVRAALLRMRVATLLEPGNLAYVVHEQLDESSAFVLYEQYVDRAAFDAHTGSAHFAEHIVGTVRPRLSDRTVLAAEVL